MDHLVSEEHLYEIARLIVASRRDLAPFLELTWEEVGIDESNTDIYTKNVELLKAWRKKFAGQASYRFLIEAAKNSGDGELASKINTLIAGPQEGSIPREGSMQRKKDLEESMKRLMNGVIQDLVNNNISTQNIIHHFMSLPGHQQGEHYIFIREIIKEMDSLTNIHLFLHELGLYVNFLDYSFLKEIIKSFCQNQELLKAMEIYEGKVDEFRKNTTIATFLNCWDGERKVPRNFSKIRVRQDLDAYECTLSDLEKYRKRIGQQFGSKQTPRLVEIAMIFHSVETGSICTTFLVPDEILPGLRVTIRDSDNMRFFIKNKISSISLRNEVLYESSSSTDNSDPSYSQSSSSEPVSEEIVPAQEPSSDEEIFILDIESPKSPTPGFNGGDGISSLPMKFELNSCYSHMNRNGQYPSICINNEGWVIQVYHRETIIGLPLRYRIGYLDTDDIIWSSHYTMFDKGFFPRIAVNSQGMVVVVFVAQRGKMMYYRLGKLNIEDQGVYPPSHPRENDIDGAYIEWLCEKVSIGEGHNPSVSLSKDGTIVTAYDQGYFNIMSYYRIGDVKTNSIEWRSEAKLLIESRSRRPSVAINDKGQVAVAYGFNTDSIAYTAGEISLESADTISLNRELKYTPSGHNHQPFITLNNHGQVVAVFHALQGRLYMRYNHGTINTDMELPHIIWSFDKPHDLSSNGYYGTVAINDKQDVVTVHKSLKAPLEKSIRNHIGHFSYQ